jgi:hypothetical protein
VVLEQEEVKLLISLENWRNFFSCGVWLLSIPCAPRDPSALDVEARQTECTQQTKEEVQPGILQSLPWQPSDKDVPEMVLLLFYSTCSSCFTGYRTSVIPKCVNE